jgi:hypothetical protein
MKNFTKKQNESLSEIYRRLNCFHKGNLDANLLYLALPSEAKEIIEMGLIKPCSKEVPRALNWYNLTEKGKKFFANYTEKNGISESLAMKIFNREYYKQFDKELIQE